MILASDVFESGAAVDRLLFGTLLGLDTADLVLSAVVAVLAVAAARRARPDLVGGRASTRRRARARAAGGTRGLLLLALVAVAAVAAIPAVGALLVTAIYVVPRRRPACSPRSIRGLVACALAWPLAEGVVGLYLAYWLDIPARARPWRCSERSVCLALAARPRRGRRA